MTKKTSENNKKICKNCVHWKSISPGSPNHCCLKASSSDGSADDLSSLAIAKDSESYRAYLETQPEFGCIQWEAKDKKVSKCHAGGRQ